MPLTVEWVDVVVTFLGMDSPTRRASGPAALLVALALGAAACGGSETADPGVDVAAGDDGSTDGLRHRWRLRHRCAALRFGSAPADVTGGADDATASETAPTPAPDGPVLDPSVLSGEVTTISGETFDLGSLAGQDLVVWFWAPW